MTPLPGAPVADTAGLTGAATGTTAEGGDAGSVFASLLTALQTGETPDADVVGALGLLVTDGEVAVEEGDGEAPVETPAGLAALIQSLTAPTTTATPSDGNADVVIAGDEATTLQVPTDALTVVDAETPSPQPQPTTATPTPDTTPTTPAPAAGTSVAASVTPTMATSAAETNTVVADSPTVISDATAGRPDAIVVDADQAAAPELELAAEPAEASSTDAVEVPDDAASTDPAPTVDVELPDGEPVDSARGQVAVDPDGSADAGDSPGSSEGSPDRGQTTRPQGSDAGSTAEATSTTAPAPTTASAPGADAARPTRAAGDQIRVISADATGPATQPAGLEANPAAATAAVTQTAAPTGAERADAPIVIERMTLREMPTVVVDRVRAVDPQGGTNRAVVRLDPPELGRIMLEIVSNGDEISVIARADTAEAARALIRQRAEIEAAVEALGLSVSDFDVQADDRERNDGEPDARRDGGYDGRRAQTDPGYVTTDLPETEGELFL